MTNPSEVMYHAQCPSCATVRKISLLQLQENKGLVTCRRCEHTYPARGHLLSLEQLEKLMSQAGLKNKNNPNNTSASGANPPQQADTIAPIQNTIATANPVTPNKTAASQMPEPEPIVMEHVFVGMIDEESSSPAKPAKTSGLLSKLLSRKNNKQNPQPVEAVSEVIFETIPLQDASGSFAETKAKLHLDTTPQEHQSAATVEAITTEPTRKPSKIIDEIEIESLDLSHIDALESVKMAQKSKKSTSKQDLPAVDIGVNHDNTNHDDQNITPIIPNQSKLDALLVRSIDENPLRTLQETEVMAPEYDANGQWFTQVFQTMQLHSTQTEPAAQSQIEHAAHSNEDNIQTAKRMNESGNSNTVTMRLPENSMLVFTLEDNGTTQSMLELPRPDMQPQGQTSVIHTVEVTNQQNEHTMWTVANIVAILILILQMFYYFLLLTP